jgi:CAAX protease family protein
MNVWIKILIFFLLWFLLTGLFSGIIYLVYPESFSGSRSDFDVLMSTNYGFLVLSQVAVFLGTFSSILFVSKFIDRKKPWFLKSMLEPRGMFAGILLGALEILLILIILSFTNDISISFQGIGIEIVWYIVVFLIVAIQEEAMSRGFVFSNLYFQTNKYLAIIVSSSIFSLMHIFNSSFSLIGMINILIVGIFFCQLYLKNMNLSIPIGYHFSWNLLQGPVFGFSVSGFETKGIFKIENVSGEEFSFEGFGLEGTVMSTIVITFFIVLFYWFFTRKTIQLHQKESKESNVAKT